MAADRPSQYWMTVPGFLLLLLLLLLQRRRKRTYLGAPALQTS
jgi:LPXTG-motif cell wall-anchored protein